MIKAVIFDMDGVIVDNRDIHVEAFRELAARYGVPFDSGNLGWMYGRGNDTILPGLFPPAIIERVGLRELGAEKEAIYRDIYSDGVHPTRGLVSLLNSLHRHGVPCAVGSSAPKVNVDFVLEKCLLQDDFTVVVTGDMVTKRKPDPAIFTLAAELLGFTPQECLVFEDSVAGIEAARAAGCPVIALSTTLPRAELEKHAPRTVIPDFTGLFYTELEKLFA